MAGGIVQELLQQALDPGLRIGDLLRKTRVVARKLGIEDMAKWVEWEQRGYVDTDDVPDYRQVVGELKAQNPWNGTWMPCILDSETMRKLTRSPCGQPAEEIEDMVARSSPGGTFMMQFDHETRVILSKAFDWEIAPSLHIPISTMHQIVSAVRDRVVEWTMNLDEMGVRGEGMTFTTEERELATTVTFNIGEMHGSQIQQGSSGSSQNITTNLLEANKAAEAVLQALPQLGLDQNGQMALRKAITELQREVNTESPDQSRLRSAAASATEILKSSAGSVLAQFLGGMLEKAIV